MAREAGFTARAQARVKTGEGRPNFRVRVGSLELVGEDVGTVLKAVSVAYDCASGTSEATIATSRGLEDLINAPVSVEIGYGRDLSGYFDGVLGYVDDDHVALENSGTAWGPFKQMSGRRFVEQADYRGWPVGDFYLDVFARAGFGAASVDLNIGRNFNLQGEGVIFPRQAFLADAVRQVADAAGHAVTDLPGGRRTVRMRPRVGQTGKAKATYDPGTYKSFKATSETRHLFGFVLIFRLGQNGAPEFQPVEREVHAEGPYKPGPGRPYVIDDYVGDREDAERDADVLADALSRGLYACRMEGFGANPDLLPFDTVETEAVEWRDGGYREKEAWSVSYEWPLDGTLGATIDAGGMLGSAAGNGIRTGSRKIPRNRFVTDRRRSPYVVRSSA